MLKGYLIRKKNEGSVLRSAEPVPGDVQFLWGDMEGPPSTLLVVLTPKSLKKLKQGYRDDKKDFLAYFIKRLTNETYSSNEVVLEEIELLDARSHKIH